MAETEEFDRDTNNVYGAIDEDLELQTIDNPYYGGEVYMASENDRQQRCDPGERNMEMVTAQSNIYYGLWYFHVHIMCHEDMETGYHHKLPCNIFLESKFHCEHYY